MFETSVMKGYFSDTKYNFFFCFIFLLFFYQSLRGQETELFKEGINLIPYPKEVKLKAGDFILTTNLDIVLDRNASEQDRFSADILKKHLSDEFKIEAV